MKSRAYLKLLLCSFVTLSGSNCSNCNNPICLNYEPKILSQSKSRIGPNQVQLIQTNYPSHSEKTNFLKRQGKQLIGEARFNSGFVNLNNEAKQMATQVGADTIVMSYRKVGKARGDRMVLTARTDPTVGLTTSNIIGSVTSSAYGSYGAVYGNSTFSGTGFSTTYNPGQTLYTRQEYEYDQLEYVFSFYGN
jgi:hypothetical protein